MALCLFSGIQILKGRGENISGKTDHGECG